jgi:hypothetical protein
VIRPAAVSLFLLVALDAPLVAAPAERASVLRVVSPAGTDASPALADACPTFSWTAVPGARGFEVRVYRLEDAALGPPVVRKVLPPGTTLWALDGACLIAGGHYGWAVRALAEEGAGRWSAPAIFQVRQELTPQLIAAVVDELRGRGLSVPGVAGGSDDNQAVANVSEESVSTAAAAIRNEVSASSGESYGVVGISHSSEGAGVGAIGATGGADFVLDGATDSQTDTRLSQAWLDRRSGQPETFDFRNSGAGAMNLTVDGSTVIHTGNLTNITTTGVLGPTTINGVLTLQTGYPLANWGNITLGSAATTSLTVTTDGTGNSEVVLPWQAIGTSAKLAPGMKSTVFVGRVNNLPSDVPPGTSVSDYALPSGSLESPQANEKLVMESASSAGCTATNLYAETRNSVTGAPEPLGWSEFFRNFRLIVNGFNILECTVFSNQNSCVSSGSGWIPPGAAISMLIASGGTSVFLTHLAGRLGVWKWECR